MKRIIVPYGAGSAGALLIAVLNHFANTGGVLAFIRSSWILPLSIPALYSQLVWGGVWGFCYWLPGIPKLSWIQSGLLMSFFPTLAELLYFMPHGGDGWFGLKLGMGTPIAVFLLNLIWGTATAFAINKSK